MIRPIGPEDTPALVALACSSELFSVEELPAIQAMLDDYHATKIHLGHSILTYVEGNLLLGIAYFAPREFADRVWELLMIAVDAQRHREGIGSQLLLAVEDAVRKVNGRMLLIETSDQTTFERTRRFYRKHNYEDVARIPDYFSDGEGKVSFIKRM